MEFHSDQARSHAARNHWLIRLRWIAVACVLLVVTISGPFMGILDDSRPLYIVLLVLALWNGFLSWKDRRGLPPQPPGRQVTADLLILGALLFFSGGLHNPFAVFLVVQVILGAILLDATTSWRVGAIGGGIAILLWILDLRGLLPHSVLPEKLPPWAAALAILVTMAVALHLTLLVMEDLRDRSRLARQYHERAERERMRLADVLRFAGAAMVLLDEAGRVEWRNDHAREMFPDIPEGSPFQLPGGPDWDFSRGGPARDGREFEWQRGRTGGDGRTCQVTVSPVASASGGAPQWVLLFTDVTGQRAAERNLHRTEKLAALGRLAAGLAHELNTPLGSVAILTGEALADMDAALAGDRAGAASAKESLRDIKRETERMSRLVRRLLDLSHPEPSDRRLVSASVALRDAIRLASLRSRDAGERIRLEMPRGDFQIETESGQLKQVLINLLDNAIHATRENRKPIFVRAFEQGGHATIQVDDRGSGIRPEDLQRAFDPFFTTKGVGEGTGLGLYVSYEIMKGLGGEIALASNAGEGTLATLTMPLSCPAHP